VWKRLTNLARGQAKVWTRPAPRKDAVLDAEIEATARADAARRESEGLKADGAKRRWDRDAPAAPVRDPAAEPVARTDLLPSDPAEGDDAEETERKL
jgi:hypothetical protein